MVSVIEAVTLTSTGDPIPTPKDFVVPTTLKSSKGVIFSLPADIGPADIDNPADKPGPSKSDESTACPHYFTKPDFSVASTA